MIAIHECGFRDLWPLPCWKYRDSLNATTNVAFSRPVWICMLWISWWKCPVNWNASLFLAQLHQIDGDWTFPHFSFTVPLTLFRCVDFTKCINKKCLLTLWDAFFCTVHLKKCFQQLSFITGLTNVGAVNGGGGSAEKTQNCSANKHINYLLKHEGGGNKILASETQLPVSRRGRRQDEQKGSSILMRRSFRRAWCEYTWAAGLEADVLMFPSRRCCEASVNARCMKRTPTPRKTKPAHAHSGWTKRVVSTDPNRGQIRAGGWWCDGHTWSLESWWSDGGGGVNSCCMWKNVRMEII